VKNLSSIIFAVAVLFFAVNEIQASCPTFVQHPPCVEYWRADAVFIATATKVEMQPALLLGMAPPSTIQFAVDEIFKGIEGKQFVLEQSSCGYQFREGEKYLVYAHRNPNAGGKLFVRLGSTRTKPFAEAAEDLQYLRSLQHGEPQAQIMGKVGHQTSEIRKVLGSSYNSESHFFGAPLSNIKVFAIGAEQTYETFSDEKGEYKFFGLPAGEYEIWADYPSYFQSQKIKVRTESKGCGIGNINAYRKGSIGGRVTDAGGAPAKYVRLSLVSADASPGEIFEERENDGVWYLAAADEKGEYRFAYLPAGRYYVIINRTNFERSREPEYQKIPRLFYPNAKNIEEAAIIEIKEGEQVSGKDFRLPKID
jgi:hypothetical protein